MAQLHATVRLLEGTTSIASSRTHSVTIDRPLAAGGTDLGFLGGELILAGQGGCFLSNLVAAARARSVDLGRVTVHVTGEAAEGPSRFSSVRVVVDLEETDTVTREVAQHLITIAERSCIATNTLRSATPLEVTLESAPADA